MEVKVSKDCFRQLSKVLKSNLYSAYKRRRKRFDIHWRYIRLAIPGLEVCLHSSDERLAQAATFHKIDGLEATSISKTERKEWRLQNWEDKSFTCAILQANHRSKEREELGLKNRDAKRETESLYICITYLVY